MVRTNFSVDFWSFRIFDCNFVKIMAPPDATEKKRNIDAQLQSILYTTNQKRFWKIYFL